MNFITEGDIYRLAAKSELPGAQEFESWIFDEVLPSIRRNGAYVTPEIVQKILVELENEITRLTVALKGEKDSRIALEEKTGYNDPENVLSDAIVAYKQSIAVGELAKLLRKNGVEIGRNTLFDWLRRNGYLHSYNYSHNMPTQKSMKNGLFEIREESQIGRTPKVSKKGQEYFVNIFLSKENITKEP